MTVVDLEQRLRSALAEGADLIAIRRVLADFAEPGGTQTDAEQVLGRLHEDATSEEEDDRILEALDIVMGFISRHMRVW